MVSYLYQIAKKQVGLTEFFLDLFKLVSKAKTIRLELKVRVLTTWTFIDNYVNTGGKFETSKTNI
jgi:hypothetical protein